jgi:hypothetical protein
MAADTLATTVRNVKDLCDSVVPLSPFMWTVPSCGPIVPVGWEQGVVADVCVQAKNLSLRFEQLAGELEGPYYHPVSDAFRLHPFHTHALSKHQFDVLRYGMVLDASAGLVLVPVPRQCGDSGSLVAHGYEAIHGAALNDSDASQHPLHEEYVFVVYKLETDVANDANGVPSNKPPQAKALFRIVFRNEAYLKNPSPDQSKHFPMFILRAVYISNDDFYRIHEVIAAHRKYHKNPVNPDTGAPSPDPRLLVELQKPEVIRVADAWLQVLEGIIPTRVNLEGISIESTIQHDDQLSSPRRSLMSASPTKTVPATQFPTLLDNQRYPSLSSKAVRLAYYTNGKRMTNRIDVVQKTRSLISTWRSGSMDVSYFATEQAAGPAPTQLTTPCTRILFRETRSGSNYIEDDELVAFLPQESDVERLVVYDHLPAERLRLWVLRALLTAELHGRHVLLLELDSAFMIAQCVGLLRGSETNSDREVLFHLCKIIVETIEDYMQHSGNIWKTTIAVADKPPAADGSAVDVVALCRDILECIQLSKHRLEIARVTSGADGENVNALPELANGASLIRNVDAASLFTPQQLAAQRSLMSENVVFAATTHRVFVTDERLYPLFCYCDTNNDGFVAVSELVKLFLCKENKIDRAHMERRGPYAPPLSDAEALRMQASNLVAHPLCPLDGCGLPFTEKSITEFVHSFCKHATTDGEEKLNYLEFSMMMLALAKR